MIEIDPLQILKDSPRSMIERFCREHAQAQYLGAGLCLARILSKYMLYVDTRDESLAPHLLLDGFWEIWTTIAIARRVKLGWRCIDVGAHHGYFSLLMADLVGPSGYVFVVEPQERLISLAARSARVNGFASRMRFCRMAASSEQRDGLLMIPASLTGNATLIPPQSAQPSAQDIELEPVRTLPLDEFFEGQSKIDFIKIDAEGHEPDIWDGMRGLVKLDRPEVVFELLPDVRRGREMLQSMLDAGYLLRRVDWQGDLVETTVHELLECRELQMVWLVPSECPSRHH